MLARMMWAGRSRWRWARGDVIAIFLGTLIGVLAGYFRGWTAR
jgi:ABC-type dipeptide/oligopeptide/nickel transport system permease subunit